MWSILSFKIADSYNMAVVRNDTPEGARIEMEEMPQPNLGVIIEFSDTISFLHDWKILLFRWHIVSLS